MLTIDKVREYLRSVGLEERLIVTKESSATVELAAKAVGTEPGRIAKSLTFLVGDKPVMILAAGTARIDNRKFKDVFHTKAKMIPGALVEEYVGHAPGGVCPFVLKEGVEVYMDRSLLRYDVVYPAGGSPNSAVRLTPKELEKASGSLGYIDVCRE